MSMRILIVLHQFFPEFRGGTERVALNLARSAQRAGHYVHILACAVNEPLSLFHLTSKELGAFHGVYEGVPVTLIPNERLPAAASFSFAAEESLIGPLSKWMKHERFDLAHVMHPMRMGTALQALQKCSLPYMVTLTDFYYSCYRVNQVNLEGKLCSGAQNGARCGDDCLNGPWTRDGLKSRHLQATSFLSGAAFRICPSEYVADKYKEDFPGLDFSVIPHGVDLLAMISNASSNTPTGSSGLTLGYVGAIIPQKGLDILLQAFSKVADPSIKLLVVGGMYGDPVFHKEVHGLIASDSRVEFIGEVSSSKVYSIIQTLDVLCLPSLVPETFSLVLHEAAAAGVPAMVSDIGAPRDYILQQGGGAAVTTGDVDAWMKVILELTSNREILAGWKAAVPLPLRIEEESFFYESLYRQLLIPAG